MTRKLLSTLLALMLVLLSCTAAFAQTTPVELTFWDMKWGGDTYIATAKKLTEQFNAENPGIHVNYQSIVWDNYYQTFLTAVTGGAAPDVSTGAFPQAVQYAQMGEILDLNPILEKWKAENDPILKDFTSESMVTMESYDGLLAGLPWNSDPRQIWYNEKAFEEAGITTLPTTWAEFEDCCKLIKEKTDYIPFSFGGGDHMATQFAIGLFTMNGIGFSNPEGTGAFTETDKAVECLSFLGDLVKNGYMPEGIAGYTGDNSNLLYLSGKVAMTWTSPLNNLSEYPGMAEITDALPPLKGTSAEVAQNYIWPNYMMAFSQTKHPDEARIFLEWWVKNCAPLYFEGDLNSMPALYSTLNNEFYSGKHQAQEILTKVLPVSTTPVYPAQFLYPVWSTIEGETYANPAIQSVLTGATNYEELVTELQSNIQALFDDMAA